MGQYFKIINQSKHEFICPWCIGGGAKLWEWAANPQIAVLSLLLRKSSESGGGDYNGPDWNVVERRTEDSVAEAMDELAAGLLSDREPMVGRWAGDAIHLIGDYDDSELYDQARSWQNISEQVVAAWNPFIKIESYQLAYKPCSSCS